jgi:hypothetical protein
MATVMQPYDHRMADPSDPVSAARLVGSLGSVTRLRVAAALILGAGNAAQVRAATGLDTRTVHRELDRLAAAGVVGTPGPDGQVIARLRELAAAARAVAKAAASEPAPDPAVTAEERVRRSFLKDGRLLSIPSQRSKRLVVLDVLAQEFEPGRRYPEREVNRRLRAWNDDVAALRRFLVDERFMEREHGVYWRAGGSFDIDS